MDENVPRAVLGGRCTEFVVVSNTTECEVEADSWNMSTS